METDPNAPSLTDRIVVVTGAAGRLGRVVTSHLEAAGAHVAGLDREPHDVGALSLRADVVDEADVKRAFDEVEAQLGPIHGVVHTVGMWGASPLAETSLDGWRTILDVNLTSAFLVFRASVRRMRGAGGRIVGIASGQGVDKGVAEQAAYSASKAGVMRLVESVAAEFRDAEITAAAIAPSMILFGEEPPGMRGVEAAEVARLCVTLCGPAGTVHNGSVMRAYGSMR